LTISFDLTSKQLCGLTKVYNAYTGRTIYYHKIVVERVSKKRSEEGPAEQKRKEVIPIKCDFAREDEGGSNAGVEKVQEGAEAAGYEYQVHEMRLKRQAFPAGFQEPE
jgi:hypothetical protein